MAKAHLSKPSLTCRLAVVPKTSSNFSSSASGCNEKYSLCLQPFDLAVSWDIAATAKYAGDLSVWFSSKTKRAFHLRCLRNVSSHLIYWGTLFCGANTQWVTPLCPKSCGSHREREGFSPQRLLTSDWLPLAKASLRANPSCNSWRWKARANETTNVVDMRFPFHSCCLTPNFTGKMLSDSAVLVFCFGFVVVFFLISRLNEWIFSCLVNNLNMQVTWWGYLLQFARYKFEWEV